MRKICIVILCLCLSSCVETLPDGPPLARVDLQSGFSGLRVNAVWNQNSQIYRSEIISSEPFSGPQASFSSVVEQGDNMLRICWYDSTSSCNYVTREVELNGASEYYLGLQLFEGSLIIEVSDEPFLYQ